jgi:hypothetical protein
LEENQFVAGWKFVLFCIFIFLDISKVGKTVNSLLEQVLIGLKYQSGIYVWSDKSKIDLSYWRQGAPVNSSKHDCVVLRADHQDYASRYHKWDDYACRFTYRAYVCKKLS